MSLWVISYNIKKYKDTLNNYKFNRGDFDSQVMLNYIKMERPRNLERKSKSWPATPLATQPKTPQYTKPTTLPTEKPRNEPTIPWKILSNFPLNLGEETSKELDEITNNEENDGKQYN